MWIQKTNSGKCQYCERYRDPLTGTLKRVSVTLSDDKRMTRNRAVFLLQGKINEALRGAQSATRESMTLGKLCDLYIAHQEKVHKEQTARTTEWHLVRLRELLGEHTEIKYLTASYIRDKLNTGAPSLFNGRMKYMRSMIRWAYEEELVDSTACVDRVKDLKDFSKREKLKEKYLERDELKALLDSMVVEQWRLLTEFLVLSGLRIGEALALRVYDIYDRHIHVERTFSLTIRLETSVKTDASYREVYMQDELIECYQKIMEYHKGFHGDLLFRRKDGARISYDAYSKYLRENTERLFHKKLSPHAMRHTHVALLAEQGMSLEAIAHRLGHSDSKITKDVYYHITSTVRQRENEQIKGISLL